MTVALFNGRKQITDNRLGLLLPLLPVTGEDAVGAFAHFEFRAHRFKESHPFGAFGLETPAVVVSVSTNSRPLPCIAAASSAARCHCAISRMSSIVRSRPTFSWKVRPYSATAGAPIRLCPETSCTDRSS